MKIIEYSMVKKNIVIFVLLALFALLFVDFDFFKKFTSVKVDVSKECQTKRTEYEQQIARKEYWNASFAMKRCANDLSNSEYQQLADSAEVKARISDIKDKTKSASNRINEIEVLEKFFPSDAQEFIALKRQLISEVAKADAVAHKAKVAEEKAIKIKKKNEGVSIGMTKEDVLASSWGKPERVNTTTNAYGVSEQWVYGGRNYLYFKDGILYSIQN